MMTLVSKLTAILFLLLVALRSVFADYDENQLPFNILITQDFNDSSGALINKGTRGILLRPLEGGYLLIDIPRRGAFQIPVAYTDALDQVNKLGASQTRLFAPRMAYFFANRIVSGTSGWETTVRSEEVNEFVRWLILYCDSSDPRAVQLISAASQYFSSLPEDERDRTVVIYMDPEGSKEGIANLAREVKPTIYTMPGYLSRGYSKTLAHFGDTSELPLLVEVASSGRIIQVASGETDIYRMIEDF